MSISFEKRMKTLFQGPEMFERRPQYLVATVNARGRIQYGEDPLFREGVDIPAHEFCAWLRQANLEMSEVHIAEGATCSLISQVGFDSATYVRDLLTLYVINDLWRLYGIPHTFHVSSALKTSLLRKGSVGIMKAGAWWYRGDGPLVVCHNREGHSLFLWEGLVRRDLEISKNERTDLIRRAIDSYHLFIDSK